MFELGGRRFTIRGSLLVDLALARCRRSAAELRRPLLVLHSPGDELVGVDNARTIFDTARHPKSFVAVDGADHLLTRGRPADDAERAALPVAGDDEEAKDVVLALVDELGFDGVDAGPLAESWRQQPGTAVYGTDLPADELRTALAAASPERTPEWRA